jgi:hypothetical protein
MTKTLLLIAVIAALVVGVSAAFAKGGDDGPGDDHGDNAPAQVVNGNDDPANHDAGDDDGQNAGADDKGAKADDPAGHDAGDDKGGSLARRPQTAAKAKHRAKSGVAGTCTGRSSSKLKANQPRNGRIEVEFEVESHVSGQVWTVRMDDNGATFVKGDKTTKAPGGSFEAKASAKNQAGTDAIGATATNAATDETCSASVSV